MILGCSCFLLGQFAGLRLYGTTAAFSPVCRSDKIPAEDQHVQKERKTADCRLFLKVDKQATCNHHGQGWN